MKILSGNSRLRCFQMLCSGPLARSIFGTMNPLYECPFFDYLRNTKPRFSLSLRKYPKFIRSDIATRLRLTSTMLGHGYASHLCEKCLFSVVFLHQVNYSNRNIPTDLRHRVSVLRNLKIYYILAGNAHRYWQTEIPGLIDERHLSCDMI